MRTTRKLCVCCAGLVASALTAQEVAALVRKEQLNAYGVLAPGAVGPEGERRLRGGALYAHASLINHECIPNITRFDCFDGVSGSSCGSLGAAADAGDSDLCSDRSGNCSTSSSVARGNTLMSFRAA